MARGKTENWDNIGDKKWKNTVTGDIVDVQPVADRFGDGYEVRLNNGIARHNGKRLIDIEDEDTARSKAVDYMEDNPYGTISQKWVVDALSDLKEKLGETMLIDDQETDKPSRFIARKKNKATRYYVYKNEDALINQAQRNAKQMLKTNPQTFNDSFLKDHLYISETDKRMLAQDMARSEADAKFDGKHPEEREEWEMERAEEIEKKLEQNPKSYLVDDKGLYTEEQFMNQDFVQIDVQEAAKDAVSQDGTHHFLRDHDREIILDSGARAFKLRE